MQYHNVRHVALYPLTHLLSSDVCLVCTTQVNPFEGKAKPQYLDQVHKTQMYYNVAETRNMTARTAQTTTSVTAHAKATPRSMPDNDFKHLIGGQYQTDWVADQKKMKAKARANKKKVRVGMCMLVVL